MLRSIRFAVAVLCAATSLAALPALATAAGPATVTVRVEGASETLLPPTQVTTSTAPVVKDGKPEDSCPGTDAIGALQIATGGDWSGSWFNGLGYSLETVLGETYSLSSTHYWTFWWNDRASEEAGICSAEMKNGDSILFFPECDSECPAPPSVLGMEAPSTAEPGGEVDVTVTSYSNPAGTPSPAAGATVAYEGDTATTDSQGHVTLRLARTGEQLLRASAPGSIRTEAYVCVHAGNDGTCGTTAPTPGAPSPAPAVVPAPYRGPYALVADVTSVLDGRHYARGHAPRLISGTIRSHSTVTGASLELRRSYRGRCWAYEASRARFLRARCGTGRPFQVSTGANFSYLLPASLPPGRYVLDVTGTDAAGNTLTLARGTSRLVFYVG